jgi:hypothetical protein
VLLPGLPLRAHYAVSADGQRFLIPSPLGSQTVGGSNVILNWAAEARRK